MRRKVIIQTSGKAAPVNPVSSGSFTIKSAPKNAFDVSFDLTLSNGKKLKGGRRTPKASVQ